MNPQLFLSILLIQVLTTSELFPNVLEATELFPNVLML